MDFFNGDPHETRKLKKKKNSPGREPWVWKKKNLEEKESERERKMKFLIATEKQALSWKRHKIN